MITFATFVTLREYNRDMSNKQETQWLRTITMTEPEEAVLVSMAKYFVDMGLPDDVNESDFDSLVDKICEPSPFDYKPYGK